MTPRTPFERALVALQSKTRLSARSLWLKSAASNQSFVAWQRQVLSALQSNGYIKSEMVDGHDGYALSDDGLKHTVKLLGLTKEEAKRGLAIAPSIATNRMVGRYIPSRDDDIIVRSGARDHETVCSL